MDVHFAIYLITFTGFVLYIIHWVEKRIKEDECRPHALIVNGVCVKESVTCNPDFTEFETIDPSIRTITDIRKYYS